MNTPLCDFIENYINKDGIRLHVPGHKGKENPCDITEIDGADVLYHENGILEESQKNASRLFNTAKTLYSAEGSSLCIRAMLSLIRMYAEKTGKRPLVAATRNAHKVFMTASALSDIDVMWIYPEEKASVVSAVISPEELDKYLGSLSLLPVALYITSPDYLGNLSDIKGISEVCKKYGILLAVDNAHGAYLNFLPENLHPIHLGADICCDSAHKTLPVLTGGAYLHISEKAPSVFSRNAKKAMSLFSSTSPSYLILSSLDKVNLYLNDSIKNELKSLIHNLSEFRKRLSEAGFVFVGNEPLKITIEAKSYGYTGNELSDILRSKGIECEFADPDFLVMMFTPFNTEKEISFTRDTLLSIPAKKPIEKSYPEIPLCERVLSIREALLKPSEMVPSKDSYGRILASPSVTCPPAVPIAICGERLTKEAVLCFTYYGIEYIDVIEE